MKLRHILLLAAIVLTACLTVVGQASARHLGVGSVTSQTPDLIERYVQRQSASSYYTPAALKADALRMQAMVRAYERSSTSSGTTSSGFDVSDALIGAAGGLGVAICAGGLLIAVARTRRPQVAL
jgi:curli biogenesis system outer membrane secretion channel CsgG